MLESEIIEEFRYRYLNNKTNNYIFCGIEEFSIVDKIKDTCNVNFDENFDEIKCAQNIKIDLSKMNLKDIFTYTFNLLRKRGLIEEEMILEFTNKFDLLRFQGILREHRIIIQFVFYNLENLIPEEQMLLNEIYYFNSIYFNANAFIKKENFQTYFLTGNRVLDGRENYTKIKFNKFKSNNITSEIVNIHNAINNETWDQEDLQRVFVNSSSPNIFVRDNISNCDVGKEENGPVLRKERKNYVKKI